VVRLDARGEGGASWVAARPAGAARRFIPRLGSRLEWKCAGEVAADSLDSQHAQQETGALGSGRDRQLALANPQRNTGDRNAKPLRRLFDR
jgi:hypothetical protein